MGNPGLESCDYEVLGSGKKDLVQDITVGLDLVAGEFFHDPKCLFLFFKPKTSPKFNFKILTVSHF